MNINSPTTPERMKLVKAAIERAAEGPRKTAATLCMTASDAAWAARDEATAVTHMNAASHELYQGWHPDSGNP